MLIKNQQNLKLENMSIDKSTKAARGTVQCENTNINLLKANDFVADIIKKEMAKTKTLLINISKNLKIHY